MGVSPWQRSAPSQKVLLLLCLPLAPGYAQAKGTLTPVLPLAIHIARAHTIHLSTSVTRLLQALATR